MSQLQPLPLHFDDEIRQGYMSQSALHTLQSTLYTLLFTFYT